MNSKAVSLIAPISTKLSDESELEIADAFLEKGISFGEVVRRCNEYCLHNKLSAAYLLYGDPNNYFGSSEKKKYYLEVIDNELRIPYCNDEIFYFRSSRDDKLFFISKEKFDVNKVKYAENTVLNYLRISSKVGENISRNKKIKHFYPSSVSFRNLIEDVLSKSEILESNLAIYENNTKSNKKILELIRDYFHKLDEINTELLEYWRKNISLDKYRMYDLHYGRGYREIISNTEYCPTCGEKRINVIRVSTFDKRFSRIVKLCPSCSIVDDVVADELSVKVVKRERNGKHFELGIEFINKTSMKLRGKKLYCIRGMKMENPEFIINNFNMKAYEKMIVNIDFVISKDIPSEDKLYFTCLIAKDASISMFKRPI